MPASAEQPRVSFIIPSYRSAETLPRCLGSVFGQRTAVPFEVLVIDSSGGEGQESLVRSFPAARWIFPEARLLPGAARNRGLAEARGALAAFVDSDVVLDSDWLERALEHFGDGHAAILGALAPYPEKNRPGLCLFHVQFSRYFPGTPRSEPPMAATFALLLRAAEARAAGGFAEDLPMLEDFEFSLRLRALCRRPIRFHPALRARHINKKGWAVLRAQLRSHGLWAARVRRRPGFPGGFLVRAPLLALVLPPYRLLLTAGRTLRWGPGPFLRFLLLAPALAWCFWVWAWAFFRSARGHA